MTDSTQAEKRGNSHQQQRRDQRCLSPETVAVVAEDRRADWSRDETDGVDTKGLQRADERIGARKIKPRKHQSGDGAVQEEVVPFNRRPDRASQNCAAELPPMLCLVDNAGTVTSGHLASLVELSIGAAAAGHAR